MEKFFTKAFIAVLVLALLGFVVSSWGLFSQRSLGEPTDQVAITPTTFPQANINPSPSPVSETGEASGDEVQAEIPTNWTFVYDGALNYQMAYPSDWFLRPATNNHGESAVLSFDPEATPNTGGIPQQELKVAVVYFAPYSNREAMFEQSEIVSNQEVTVDGFSAQRVETTGGAGGSISTQVNTKDGTYLISAYPANSDQIDLYYQILDYIDLDAESMIQMERPQLGAEVSSPLIISGSAPGSWFFEANLPLSVKTNNGQVLAKESFIATGEWMTQDLVEFSQDLTFDQPKENLGYISIENNNPSGFPKNQIEFTWPIEFK